MKKIITFVLLCFCLSVNAYQVSPKCKEHIKTFESCVLKVDRFGQIGYGHLNQNGEHYRQITKAKAEQLFNQDIAKVNESVNRLIGTLPYKFSQGFVDGLGSLIYNCGEAGVMQSTFYQRLLKCRFKNKNCKKDLAYTLCAVLTLRCNCKGLKKRRKAEYDMMSLGEVTTYISAVDLPDSVLGLFRQPLVL